MHTHSLPRALAGRVFAAPPNDDPQELFREINATLGQLGEKHRTEMDNIVSSLSAMQRQIDGGYSNASPTILPVDPEYSQLFASFVRKGDGEQRLTELNGTGERAAIQAALSVGTDSQGGVLAPIEWDRKVSQAQVATSPMRRLAKVVTTSVGAFSTLWNDNAWGSGWVGETAARPITTTPTLSSITFAAGEIYAQPTVTQRLLDDAAIDVAAWLIDALRVEFNRQEGIAFLSGNGVNKPAGLLTFIDGGANADAHPGGNITVVDSAITVDALVDFMYGLAAPYRAGSAWLMASTTAALLTKLKDADGNLIWRESLIVGQPATLLGRPVEIDEGMPAPTAGNIAIAFGSFADAYLINERLSLRILRDPFTNKPFVNFYATKRIGGGLLDPNAMRLLRIPA